MEKNLFQEPCGHTDCDATTRIEYCDREARESPDDVELLVSSVEYLLNSANQGSTEFSYSGSTDQSLLKRSFEFSLAPNDDTEIIETREYINLFVEQLHRPNRRSYTIVSSWCAVGDDVISTRFKRIYTIETYTAGAAQMTVTEPEMTTDLSPVSRYIDRPMTGYDMYELFKILSQIRDVNQSDETYVDRESYNGWAKDTPL